MMFFKLYGLSINYDKILNMMSEDDIKKPFFCWMIATVYNKSSEADKKILFDSNEDYLAKLFLYQQFIHNVFFGMPKNVAREEYEEWYKKSMDEKKYYGLSKHLTYA